MRFVLIFLKYHLDADIKNLSPSLLEHVCDVEWSKFDEVLEKRVSLT